MAASKKSKSSAKSRVAKKPAGKKQVARPSAKSAAAKRNRRADTKRDGVKSPRKQASRPTNGVTQLSSAALGREPERKPVKKAERPSRPPAVLPIPQSTFFF